MKCPKPGREAFTLIEVVISSALMALILVASYICFSASIASRKTMEPRLEVIQNARVAMAMIAADLRAACPLDKDTQFLGMHRTMGETVADNLDFASHNYTPQRPGEGDFCQLSYYLDRDAETGQLSLWRRRNPSIAPDPLEGGRKEEIATGLLGLQFEYFDGLDWYQEWGDTSGRDKQESSQKEQPNLTGMPEAVRITLWFDADPSKKPDANPDDLEAKDKKAPMMFQTVARLNAVSSQSDNASDDSGDAAAASETGGTSQ
ncbi:MAG TPA: prepilin-type N-terminal cleavage/methylation domain-containing protein, partial [Verrucomicrobiae bacterium]